MKATETMMMRKKKQGDEPSKFSNRRWRKNSKSKRK